MNTAGARDQTITYSELRYVFDVDVSQCVVPWKLGGLRCYSQ